MLTRLSIGFRVSAPNIDIYDFKGTAEYSKFVKGGP